MESKENAENRLNEMFDFVLDHLEELTSKPNEEITGVDKDGNLY